MPVSPPSLPLLRIALFCRVVDNFGDIGVCWRLARQLAAEHAATVTLWVDDLATFQKICAALDPTRASQQVLGVTVRHWQDGAVQRFDVADIGDLVIEGFGCTLPPAWIAAMAHRCPAPLWINLEYLSAEPWVDDCHAMVSHYAALPLKKYFFFPGFSAKTGGLLLERDLLARRVVFQSDAQARSDFLAALGVLPTPGSRIVSMFCYPHAPLQSLLEAWASAAQPVLCLLPLGVASAVAAQFLGGAPVAGVSTTRGALTLQIIALLDQSDYDRLLWACDLNFVRGEDSFVRAQWAARPLVWQIYPQDAQAHLIKLDAFLQRYSAPMVGSLRQQVEATWHAWNGVQPHNWLNVLDALPQWQPLAQQWVQQLVANGDLASNLLAFVAQHAVVSGGEELG